MCVLALCEPISERDQLVWHCLVAILLYINWALPAMMIKLTQLIVLGCWESAALGVVVCVYICAYACLCMCVCSRTGALTLVLMTSSLTPPTTWAQAQVTCVAVAGAWRATCPHMAGWAVLVGVWVGLTTHWVVVLGSVTCGTLR